MVQRASGQWPCSKELINNAYSRLSFLSYEQGPVYSLKNERGSRGFFTIEVVLEPKIRAETDAALVRLLEDYLAYVTFKETDYPELFGVYLTCEFMRVQGGEMDGFFYVDTVISTKKESSSALNVVRKSRVPFDQFISQSQNIPQDDIYEMVFGEGFRDLI